MPDFLNTPEPPTDKHHADGARHVVVGGAGFLGRAVIAKLLAAGQRIIVIARGPDRERLSHPSIEWIERPVDAVEWDTLLRPRDIVHYYAWNSVPGNANLDPEGDMKANIAPLIRLLETIRRVDGQAIRVIFPSSGGTIYGAPREIPVREGHPLAPITAYGAGKAAAELYISYYKNLYNIDCRIARLANPYGPSQNTNKGQGAIPIFFHRILHRQPIEIWGDGEAIRDYIYIDDAVDALILLATSPNKTPEFIYNIGSGVGTSLNDLLAKMRSLIRDDIEVVYQPHRGFDIPVSILDISKIQRDLGWTPAWSLSDGLQTTLEVMEITQAAHASN